MWFGPPPFSILLCVCTNASVWLKVAVDVKLKEEVWFGVIAVKMGSIGCCRARCGKAMSYRWGIREAVCAFVNTLVSASTLMLSM